MASQISTFSPYNDGSVGSFRFDGTSDYILTEANSNLELGTGEFTIELWFKSFSITAQNAFSRRLFTSSNEGNATNNLQVLLDTNDGRVVVYTNAALFTLDDSSTGSGNDGRWHHVAVVGSVSGTDRTISAYFDGVKETTTYTYNTSLTGNSGSPPQYVLGSYGDLTAGKFDGYLSDIRVVKGQAVYTSSFTPPTTALSSISGTGYSTVLLAQPGKNEDIVTDTAVLKPDKHFDTLVYTGTGTPNTSNLNGLPFKPDLVWIKSRTTTNGNNLFDSVRGAGWVLSSNSVGGEGDNTAYMTGFTNDGVSFGSVGGDTNSSGINYVAWCWKAGGAPSADGVAMVDGSATTCSAIATAASASITPTRMSVNTKAGFSIVKYGGSSTTGLLSSSVSSATIPHGLSGCDFCIIKNLDNSNTWVVSHSSIAPNVMSLQSTGAANSTPPVDSTYGQITTLGSNTVTITRGTTRGDNVGENLNSWNYIAYCWHSVAGNSAFGSYTGNESTDGPFVYTGFKPAWVMIKMTSNTYVFSSWIIYDNARKPYNPTALPLHANSNVQEGKRSNGDASTESASAIDFLSNGFKIKNNYTESNRSTHTYFYAAFAEAPSAFTNAR